MKHKRIIYSLVTLVVLLGISLTVTYSQLQTVRTIFNDVWDSANHRLMTTSWVGAQQAFQSEQTILNDVWDPTNHMLNVSGGGSGGGDFSSNTSTSVNSEIVLFSGTTGKTGKRATGTGVARVASGVFTAAELSGDCATSGSNVVSCTKLNGVAYSASPSTDSVALVTAANTTVYKVIPDCDDTGGNHLNYDTATHVFSCGTSGGAGGGHTIQDEGVSLATETKLNFKGAGVSCVDNAGVSTDCTITGSSTTPATTTYIATTGNDANDCSVGSKCLTLAHAISLLVGTVLDTTYTINIADGTYAEAIIIDELVTTDKGLVSLVGNTTTPASVVFTGSVTRKSQIIADSAFPNGDGTWQDTTHTAYIAGKVQAELHGIKLNGGSSRTAELFVTKGANTVMDRNSINGTPAYGIAVYDYASLRWDGVNTISGWTYAGAWISFHSKVTHGNNTAVLTVVGPGGTTGAAITVVKHSFWFLSNGTAGITITNSFIGFQCTLYGMFQAIGTTTAVVSITGTTPTTAGSVAVSLTDFGDWASTSVTTIDHYAKVGAANSSSYMEMSGTNNFTNITTALNNGDFSQAAWGYFAAQGSFHVLAQTNATVSVNNELPLFNGTSGTAFKRAAGTGNVRTDSGVVTQSEISGDCTTSGSNVLTCTKTNGVTMPASGTSGGIPYYSSTSAISSSALLTANKPVIGGGAGTPPAVGTVTSTNAATLFATASGSQSSGKCLEWDANGNVATAVSNAACGSGGGGTSSGTNLLGYSAPSLTLTAGTRYAPPGGGGTPSTTEADSQVKAPLAGTVGNFQVSVSVAPGTGNTYVFTWRKATADTTVTCTIADTATTCQDVTHTFTYVQNDLLDIKIVSTGTIITTPMVSWLTSVGGGLLDSGANGLVYRSSTNTTSAATATQASTPHVCTPASASGTTYTCALTPTLASYVTGTQILMYVDVVNTGSSTLNIDSLGAKTIKKRVNGFQQNLAAGDLPATRWELLTYDGTNLQVTGALGSGDALNTHELLTEGVTAYVQPTAVTTALAVSGTSAHNDLYTCPATNPTTGNTARCLLASISMYNSTAGGIVTYAEVSIGGTYFPFNAATSLAAVTNRSVYVSYVMEPGEIVSCNTASTAAVNCWADVIVFDATSAIKTVKLTTYVSGNNTLYTCPASTKCYATSGTNTVVNGNPGMMYVNNTGASRAIAVNLVPSGGSVQTANKTDNYAAKANTTVTNLIVGGLMAAGDFVNFVTDSTSTSQFVWMNVIERLQ